MGNLFVAAKIFLKHDHAPVQIIGQIKQVPGRAAAEAVNGLIRVAHHEFVFHAQGVEDRGVVGAAILEFVPTNKFDRQRDLFLVQSLQQDQPEFEQRIEVQQAGGDKALEIFRGDQFQVAEAAPAGPDEGRRANVQLFLYGRKRRFALQIGHDLAQKPLLLVFIQQGDPVLEADQRAVLLDQPQHVAVDRAAIMQAVAPVRQAPADFVRGGIGECDDHDFSGLAAGLDPAFQPLDQHARFPCAGSGNANDSRIVAFDCFNLIARQFHTFISFRWAGVKAGQVFSAPTV